MHADADRIALRIHLAGVLARRARWTDARHARRAQEGAVLWTLHLGANRTHGSARAFVRIGAHAHRTVTAGRAEAPLDPEDLQWGFAHRTQVTRAVVARGRRIIAAGADALDAHRSRRRAVACHAAFVLGHAVATARFRLRRRARRG